MISLKLTLNKAFPWFERDNIHVKGFLFDKDGVLYENEQLHSLVAQIPGEAGMISMLKDANGTFALVVNKPDFFIMAVDRFRTFPLFYTRNQKEIIICDDIDSVIEKNTAEINIPASKIFSTCGYTLGKDTLLKNISQLQAGEYATVKNNASFTAEFYHQLLPAIQKISYNEAKKKCFEIIESLTRKLSAFIGGKDIFLPLSAGLDSRLLALMLKRAGYTNVSCFTFGASNGNPEKHRAKIVAERLGFDWHYINYDTIDKTNFHISDKFTQFYPYEARYVSKFAFMQYFSADYLIQTLGAKPGAVVLPGHGGDFFSGSHLKPYMGSYKNKKQVIKDLEYIHCNLIKKSKTLRKLNSSAIEPLIKDNVPLFPNIENWDLKERQAKYIINSCKLWEFHELQYFMPLCDNEFMDFFSSLPFEFRLHQKLYKDAVFDLFKEYNIYFPEDEMQFEAGLVQKIKVAVKRMFPFLVKKQDLFQWDYFDFKTTSKPILKELEENSRLEKLRSMNSIFTEWYLLQLEKKFR